VKCPLLCAIAAVGIGLGVFPSNGSAQVVRSGTGTTPTSAALLAARDQFRVDLGGGNTAGANGSFGGLRREINWDGVPAAQSAPNNLAANFFNVNSPRGAVFSTPGTGFQVSGATTDAGAGQPAAANFGNIDPSYTATFQPFTTQRLFTALGSTITDVNFFIPGFNTPTTTNGFGAIFSDVDLTNNSSIEYFNTANASLGKFFVPSVAGGNQTLEFLGVSFPTSVISRVRITSGSTVLGAGVTDNGDNRELVVMDDFIYGEPLPEPAAVSLFAGAMMMLTRRRRGR
jgi:hypothetical protein